MSEASTNSGSTWRDTRNARSRARLDRALPAIFPAPVLQHALSRPLLPPTPRLAVESYWRAHILRADRLARALAARSGAPDGWTWRLGTEPGLAASFRLPPSPYREPAHARGRGHCCLCGQPVFRFGWHKDLWGAGTPNKNAAWHSACVTAWKLWCAPAEQVTVLKRHQRHRCTESGKRLFKTAEVDHRVPLYRVWREHRTAPWPELLGYWGAPNLQVVNRVVHVAKCGAEAGERAARRRAEAEPVPSPVSADAYGETDFARVDAHVIQPEEYDELPELTDAMMERADHYDGPTLVRRGRAPKPAARR